MRSASAAVIRSPVNKYSLARAKPISCGQIRAPPSPATRPALTCESPILAWSAAIMMSAKQGYRCAKSDSMAIDPCDDRFVAFQHAEDDPLCLRHTGLPCVGIVDLFMLAITFPPAENARPAPVQDDHVH